jgi:predicted TIM-barrel fold metal-dependent hydrolase
MQIIDAQVHIWSSGTPSGHHRQTSSFTAEDLIWEMDQAGVNGAVLHPPAESWDPRSNELAVAAVKTYPDKFAIIGWFPLDRPEERQRIREDAVFMEISNGSGLNCALSFQMQGAAR